MDRGANGGIAGNDCRIVFEHQREVDVTGIDNHEISALKIVDAVTVVMTQDGPRLAYMRQYAYLGQGRSIHSCGQVEYNQNEVHDKSMKIKGGRQCIITLEGLYIPIDIIHGLPYIQQRAPTDDEMDQLAGFNFTSASTWEPELVDNVLSDRDDWYNIICGLNDGLIQTPFDQYGNYKHRRPVPHVETRPTIGDQAATAQDERDVNFIEVNRTELFRRDFLKASNLNQQYLVQEAEIDLINEPNDTEELEISQPIETSRKPIDYKKYRPYLLMASTEKVKATFDATTQHAVNVPSGPHIIQTMKSPYPAHNVLRRNEPVATDTIFAEVPAICTNGQTMAQLYIGRKSLLAVAYGMSNESQMVNTLEDHIKEFGAMDVLLSDSARVEMSRYVMDVLRAYNVRSWQSEPNYQHQNFCEHRFRHIKGNLNWYMNYRNVPPELWLHCLQWVCNVMNHIAEKSLGDRPPLQLVYGHTIDISILFLFLFWDIVYVSRYKDSSYRGQPGSRKSDEIRGRFIGFAWTTGHAFTFKILTDDTKQIICRSRVRLAVDGENNLKLEAEAGNIPKRVYIRSKYDKDELDEDFQLPTIDLATNPFRIDDTLSTKKGEPTPEHPIATEPAPQPSQDDPQVGFRVHKKFGKGKKAKFYRGEVIHGPFLVNNDGKLEQAWKVRYDDGDVEDLSRAELEKWAVKNAVISSNSTETTVGRGESEDRSDSKFISGLDATTAMDDPPLRDMPEVETVEIDDDDNNPAIRNSHPDGTRNLDHEDMSTPNPTTSVRLPPEELTDRTFLMPPNEDGSRYRAKIVGIVNDHVSKTEGHPELVKLKCIVNDQYEEVVAYNKIVEFIEDDQTWDGAWRFRKIHDHQGPIRPSNPRYKGSRWNVLIEWETGEKSWEPLSRTDKMGI